MSEQAAREISEFLHAHHEWLLIRAAGNSFAVESNEIEISDERGKIIFGFLADKGFELRRITEYKIELDELTLKTTANFQTKTETIRLVPRVRADELSRAVIRARLERANRIARLIVAENPQSKLIRVSLNQEGGRFAQVIFATAKKTNVAAVADVSDSAAPEIILTQAILWLRALGKRRRQPISTVWILAEKDSYKNLRTLHALLADDWRERIVVKEICENQTTQRVEINEAKPIELTRLWNEKPPKIKFDAAPLSEAATAVVNLAASKIDAVKTRNGETLRFLGLPFARVRRVGESSKAWFGIGQSRRILNEESQADFEDLILQLDQNRRFDAANKRHEFYRAAPEAWLESVLRRDVRKLDGNLILSPVHNQFRQAADALDLLALRADGRLIVIELKVAPDRHALFQVADYWRKIELQRRTGNLRKAKVFGDLPIADQPTIVYLVAPTLAFHPDFEFLARTVQPEIEIYRFDLNENWREDLRVMRVSKAGNSIER